MMKPDSTIRRCSVVNCFAAIPLIVSVASLTATYRTAENSSVEPSEYVPENDYRFFG